MRSGNRRSVVYGFNTVRRVKPAEQSSLEGKCKCGSNEPGREHVIDDEIISGIREGCWIRMQLFKSVEQRESGFDREQ